MVIGENLKQNLKSQCTFHLIHFKSVSNRFKLFQEKNIRDFLLTNIHKPRNKYEWRVNFEAILENYHNVIGFPDYETMYLGNTLFIGGKQSSYIRFIEIHYFSVL